MISACVLTVWKVCDAVDVAVADVESVACRHMLCDSLVNIYPDPFQRAFQAGRVSALPPSGLLEVSELPSGIVQNNPVVTAAAWTAQVSRLPSFHFLRGSTTTPVPLFTAKQNVSFVARMYNEKLICAGA